MVSRIRFWTKRGRTDSIFHLQIFDSFLSDSKYHEMDTCASPVLYWNYLETVMITEIIFGDRSLLSTVSTRE